MIKKNAHTPRNKDIVENEDFEEKVIAKEKLKGKAKQKRIDDYASILSTGEEEEQEEEKDEAAELSKFIEVIIKIGK